MDIKAIVMGLTFAFMWSSAFTSARIIVTYAPPMTALSLRFLVTGVIGVAIAFAMGQNMRLTRNQWAVVLVFGLCQNALYLGLNFIAMQTVQASLAAIIASSMPLLVALIGWIVLGERVRPLGLARETFRRLRARLCRCLRGHCVLCGSLGGRKTSLYQE